MRTLWILLLTAFTLPSIRMQAADPAAGQQVEQKLEMPDGRAVPYLLYLPEGYDGKEKKWPLMLFLHGRGESYGPLGLVKKWGPPRLVERGEKLPYVIVSPQCPGDESWAQPKQQEGLVRLLDQITKNYSIDEDRVYLTGLSMGGYGSWRLAADHPDRFAAVIPVCGGGNPADAEKLKNVPFWVFHGTADPAVPFSRSQDMVDAIKKAGGKVIRFTSLEEFGHNSWSATYASPEIYDWLNKQTASQNRARAQQNP
jgi:predicted peptidase